MFSTNLAFVNLHSITFLFRYSNTTAMIQVFGICNTPERETHPSLGRSVFIVVQLHCNEHVINIAIILQNVLL